jgi:tRNA pseudouridine38-40 synthase
VHALAQCAAFTTSEERENGAPDDRLVRAINSRLDADVVVRSCERVADAFDPIRDCVGKGYRYSILDGGARPLFERARVLRVPVGLDVGAMQEAAQVLVGEHDFVAFASSRHGRESTVRTVLSCTAKRREADTDSVHGRESIEIDVSGTGFLYNMVRIIAGTLIEVGKGKMTAEQVGEALKQCDRNMTGETMRAAGLCLMWIKYRGDE